MAKKKTQSKHIWKNLVCGGAAGAIEATIMYPTEFVKTQLQLDAKASKKGGELRFTGIADCVRKTVAQKGPFGLYAGLPTLVVGSIPKAATRFAAFNFWKAKLAGPDGKLSTVNTMLSGLCAGVTEAVVAVTPMETIKTKLIHDQNSATPQYRGLIHGVATMVRTEGIGAIYKGVVPTMCKQGGNQMTRFTVYGMAQDMARGGDPTKELHTTVTLLCGSFAGFVSVYATMPFDVIKTQMQGLEAKNYSSSADCVMQIVKSEGPLALWKGAVPRLSRVMFSSALIFYFYEELMKQMLVVLPDE